jgi:micrococcal nuclease
MYEYRAKLLRVVDGDTVDLQVDLGFRILHNIRVRLAGIDTPEIFGKTTPGEREKGLEAKAYVEAALTSIDLVIRTNKTGKYGRWIADIYVPKSRFDTSDPEVSNAVKVILDEAMVHLNKVLVQTGHAKEV